MLLLLFTDGKNLILPMLFNVNIMLKRYTSAHILKKSMWDFGDHDFLSFKRYRKLAALTY